MMKSKIHRAVVTAADLNYEGSITIDRRLMEAADLKEFEQVHVLDLDNGSRFVTYVIAGRGGSGVVCINGAGARLVQPGDLVIILSYASIEVGRAFHPVTVHVDESNTPRDIEEEFR